MQAHHLLGLSRADRLPWLNISLRCLLAIGGAYALASFIGAALALTLVPPALDATLAALMVSFMLQLLAVIWVFHAATLKTATLGILVPTMLAAGWLWWLSSGVTQ